jgi:hypothetical protein
LKKKKKKRKKKKEKKKGEKKLSNNKTFCTWLIKKKPLPIPPFYKWESKRYRQA